MVGTNTALLIHDYEKPVKVHGYDKGVGEIEACRTVSAIIVYDHPESWGHVYSGTPPGNNHTPNGKQPIMSPIDEGQRRPCE